MNWDPSCPACYHIHDLWQVAHNRGDQRGEKVHADLLASHWRKCHERGLWQLLFPQAAGVSKEDDKPA